MTCEKCETTSTKEQKIKWVIVTEKFMNYYYEDEATITWKDNVQLLVIETKDGKTTVYVPYAALQYVLRVIEQ